MISTPFFKNAIACIFAGIIGTIVMLRIGHLYFSSLSPSGAVPFLIVTALVGMYLIATIVYIFVWRRKANRQTIDSSSILAFWQGVVRYFIALDLCMFGVEKFFHLQFNVPLGVLDDPFSSLSPDQLMWAFFGHFYAFVVIIGSMEIAGALLLLFTRTRLFAAIFLTPIFLNILLLDYFYNPGVGVQIYVTVEMMVLLYLLSLEYHRLVEFFFIAKSSPPQFHFKPGLWKNVLRFSAIIIPLLLMASFRFPQFYAEINGKYEVKSIVFNGTAQSTNLCSDSVLTKIFIDRNDFVMEFNNYRWRFIGRYSYNEANKNITAIWRYPENQRDTLFAKILPGNTPNVKILAGRMGKKTFKINMLRINNGK